MIHDALTYAVSFISTYTYDFRTFPTFKVGHPLVSLLSHQGINKYLARCRCALRPRSILESSLVHFSVAVRFHIGARPHNVSFLRVAALPVSCLDLKFPPQQPPCVVLHATQKFLAEFAEALLEPIPVTAELFYTSLKPMTPSFIRYVEYVSSVAIRRDIALPSFH